MQKESPIGILSSSDAFITQPKRGGHASSFSDGRKSERNDVWKLIWGEGKKKHWWGLVFTHEQEEVKQKKKINKKKKLR